MVMSYGSTVGAAGLPPGFVSCQNTIGLDCHHAATPFLCHQLVKFAADPATMHSKRFVHGSADPFDHEIGAR
jgi:hypothetical protein